MPDSQTERAPKAFTQFLQEQRRGLLSAELSDAMEAIVAAVVEHGKAGSLTISLKVKTTGDGVIAISDNYIAKIPTPPAEPSIYFADDTGRFERNRLNQDPLPFTVTQGGTAAAQAVSS